MSFDTLEMLFGVGSVQLLVEHEVIPPRAKPKPGKEKPRSKKFKPKKKAEYMAATSLEWSDSPHLQAAESQGPPQQEEREEPTLRNTYPPDTPEGDTPGHPTHVPNTCYLPVADAPAAPSAEEEPAPDSVVDHPFSPFLGPPPEGSGSSLQLEWEGHTITPVKELKKQQRRDPNASFGIPKPRPVTEGGDADGRNEEAAAGATHASLAKEVWEAIGGSMWEDDLPPGSTGSGSGVGEALSELILGESVAGGASCGMAGLAGECSAGQGGDDPLQPPGERLLEVLEAMP